MRKQRVIAGFPGLLGVILAGLLSGGLPPAGYSETPRTGTLWAPYLEWEMTNPDYSGNPFDLRAEVTFTHEAGGEMRVTPMFYDGGNVWKFRFSGTRLGKWNYRTSSANDHLDGRTGSVVIGENRDPNVRGFIEAAGNQFARRAGPDGEIEAFIPNIWMNYRRFGDPGWCGWTKLSSSFGEPGLVEEYLDEAQAHGCNGIQALLANQWFQFDVPRHDHHESENPDLETFRALERSIVQAHRRGMFVHIWAWGDEQRRWTAAGVGGINGPADQRLQRYIAARLGPLPGWTMSYGFDLFEYIQAVQVEEWAAYLRQHFGWQHLLGAREEARFRTPATMDLLAHDDRPRSNFHENALKRLQDGRPVLFERRFSYRRDHIWDMDTTRRAFWQFAIAGGAGSIWGYYPPNCSAYQEGTYPNPEQLQTHEQFWKNHFRPGMTPAKGLSMGAWVLRGDGSRVVFYEEDTEAVQMNLSAMNASQPGFAVDAKKKYELIEIGPLEAAEQTWRAPYRSDWAIAVGRFAE